MRAEWRTIFGNVKTIHVTFFKLAIEILKGLIFFHPWECEELFLFLSGILWVCGLSSIIFP